MQYKYYCFIALKYQIFKNINNILITHQETRVDTSSMNAGIQYEFNLLHRIKF